MEATGLYIHVPFCKSKCGYCDFYSLSDCRQIKQYAPSVCEELRQRLDGKTVSTIYFGGGTPSLLEADDYSLIFDTIHNITRCDFKNLEITLEANPDDMSEEYLKSLEQLPFNRLSMGIQSFNDDELSFICRRHTAAQAVQAVNRCRQYGFGNISIDLMYGLPHQSLQSFGLSIGQALQLNVEHISAYMLALEENVPLYKSLQKGIWKEVDEETAEAMYKMLAEKLTAAGYEHYEISNFALPGRRSRHNSSYWKGLSYIGIGPGAHSYDAPKQCRSWNAQDVEGYITTYCPSHEYNRDKCSRYKNNCGQEILSPTDLYNEYIMTRLRTLDGVALSELQERFDPFFVNHFRKTAKSSPSEWFIHSDAGNRMYISPTFWFISDEIIRDLIYVK